jgi:predicted O-linked N-acetylglucosamine transferase (SPINDLY family)
MTEELISSAAQPASSQQLSLSGLIEAANRLSTAGQIDQARQLYQLWIDHNRSHPQLYVAHFNCAALAGQIQDQAAAAASLNEAIALNPDFVPAYINLGRIYEESGAIEHAIELWRLAASRPASINGSAVQYATTALTQMARVLSAAQRSEEAEEAIQKCLDVNPRQPEIIEQYTALRLAQCKWPLAGSTEHLDRKTLLGGINPLSMAAYTDDPLLQLASAYRYVKRSLWDGPHNGQSDRRHAAIDLTNRRLRVGYVSSDLRDHAIGYLMAELFELHDRRNIEVFAYYCGPKSNSALTNRIKSAVENWTDINPLSDDDAAARIAADGIDILVDVNGHTRDARTGVFARRPAPIQVNWLGYPGSMGSAYHQYLIADDWIIPAQSEIYYSEKIVRLPCYQPNDRKRSIAAEQPTRSAAGLPEKAFVFCCFNGTHKISRFTFDRWLEILKRTGDSVLWLLDTSEQTKKRLHDMATQQGVSSARLIFAPKMQNSHHLARYPLADLFLDSAPYGAHTTASDALWMGVPVLTLSGRCFASRVCGSLVRSAGLTDLVYTSPQDYVERAIALAGNPTEIETYKAMLQANRDSCPLFDTGKLVNRLEALYCAMCTEHSRGLVPQPDLSNLDAYFDVGLDHDHDSEEVLKIADYHGLYRTKLRQLHLARPLHVDSRLWRKEDVAATDLPLLGRDTQDNSEVSALLHMAMSMNDAGHGASALLLLKQLVASYPDDAEALRQLAKLLNTQGKILECLNMLVTAKKSGACAEVLPEQIQAIIDPAAERFNQLIAANNIEQAVDYADALAALLPGNVTALNSALSCSVALGRTQQAVKLATSIIALEPSHRDARATLAAASSNVEQMTPSLAHPLMQLRDLYDQASAILCVALDDQGEARVSQILAAARNIDVTVPQDSEWAIWEKHYRLALQAIDMSALLDLTPEHPDKADVSFATASGKSLTWSGVQAAAKKLRAKTVFFAAADKTYVDLYGHAYIDSILEHCDVSSMIILHVIGGAKELSRMAKSMGIASDRLIFAGDTFDAGSIKTRCYDAPPKGLSPLPIAHLQSVRFLRVGSLLQKLSLPIFVSDVDLILQRGVGDLIQKFANHDIVLNENCESSNAGSRFTANLMLLNPTKNAAIFVRYLREYLEKALSGSEVSRWIDQFAIMQARHHVARRKPNTRIGYFDVNTDINNLMYPNFQEHPFRFLSLYHGFDMSSLPRKLQQRPKMATQRKKRAALPGLPSQRTRVEIANA